MTANRSAPADHQYQCRRCGAFVCTTHCDEETGLCTDCAGRTGRNGSAG
ncbi:MAG: hypothetical protein V5A44_10280 [Haloarculaceae archaeon]